MKNDRYGDTILNKQRRMRCVAEAIRDRGPCSSDIAWEGGGIVLCNACFQTLLRAMRADIGMVDELVPGVHVVRNKDCMYS